MIRASIDIGSNSCLLLVLEVSDGSHKTLESHSRVTALGKDLDKNNLFLDESIKATQEAIGEYSTIISKYKINPKNVIVIATEASRVAQNFSILHSTIMKNYGFDIQRISSEGEAYYTSLGVVKGIVNSSYDEVTVMDIGGASTELIKIQLNDFRIIESISLPIGSVRATNWLASNQFSLKITEVFKSHNIDSFHSQRLICVAGTMTTLAAMQEMMKVFNEEQIQGITLSSDQLNSLVSKLSKQNSEGILHEFPFCGKRASSIYGGALVAQEFSKRLGTEEFEISTYGLRYGVAIAGEIDERYI